MIVIKKAEIKQTSGTPRIECTIFVGSTNQKHIIWMDINKDYAKYLCIERADAFVVLLLPLAMSLGEDITCESPVTDDVLYGIERDLVPILSKYSDGFQQISIIAENAPAIPNKGAVGTGCSCGVDSLYAIKTNINTEYNNLDITHLCVFNNLTFMENRSALWEKQIERTSRVAQNLDLPLIVCNSNCMKMLPVPVDRNFLNTYAILFFVFSLQKLFARYYLGSNGLGYSAFSINDADKNNCANYDLLTLSCLSTSNLKLISACGAVTRNDKVKAIADWDIAKKHLKVCNEGEKNCGVCGKCRRTIMSLEALGALHEFNNVFNTTFFTAHKYDYYYWLYKRHCIGDPWNEDSFRTLKETPLMKEVISEDKLWGRLFYAEGLYDDGWMKKKLTAKSYRPKTAEKLILKVYIPDLIPENILSVYINDERTLSKTVQEGVYDLEIKISESDIVPWSVEFEKSIIPKEENINEDIRELTAILMQITFI